MIVPMKKIQLIIRDTECRSALRKLRRAGLVHIRRDFGKDIVPDALHHSQNLLENALAVLPKVHKKKTPIQLNRCDAESKAHEILAIKKRENELVQRLADFATDAESLTPWGDFNPIDLDILAAKGIKIHLMHVNAEIFNQISQDPDVEFVVLKKRKRMFWGAAVYRAGMPENPFVGISLPQYGLSELTALVSEAKAELAALREELKAQAIFSMSLKSVLEAVKQDIEFEEVLAVFSQEDHLAWLSGYLPAESVDSLKDIAKQESWGLFIREPEMNDPVPTLIRNAPAVRMIQPLFKLMGIFPGYREPDISAWFLIFLSLFVAMIFGDAAYGVILLIMTAIGRIIAKKSLDIFRLLTLFGITITLWGGMTGTWFASLELVRDTPLRYLVVPALATYQQELFPDYVAEIFFLPGNTFDATAMVQWLSLFFGLLMLSIARIQNFIRRLPSLAAVAQIGWLSIVLGLYWLIMNLVLQLDLPPFLTSLLFPMILGGLGVILLFSGHAPGRSFFQGLLEGLKNMTPTLLGSIGAFGDIISFIRLFAVGLASVALAQSFNAMAPKDGGSTIIVAVLVLFVGHLLNIVLNALSVLVHGVRLNVLEFSGHLDMEWAGFGFDPFRLRVPENGLPENNKE